MAQTTPKSPLPKDTFKSGRKASLLLRVQKSHVKAAKLEEKSIVHCLSVPQQSTTNKEIKTYHSSPKHQFQQSS
jgi:hypothetical protein